MGTLVESIQISNTGPLNDRLWVVIDKKTLKPQAAHNSEALTWVRQEFVDTKHGYKATKVRLFLQDHDLPRHLQPDQFPQRELILDINKDYSKSEILEAAKKYRGYIESQEACKWFGHIF